MSKTGVQFVLQDRTISGLWMTIHLGENIWSDAQKIFAIAEQEMELMIPVAEEKEGTLS